jgi:iron complex transport system substrate-binding protein
MNSLKFANGRIWPIYLLILLLLAACTAPASTTDEAAETDVTTTETVAGESAEEPMEEAAEPETRTITDAMGREVTIPADPQRIVTLSEIDTDSLLALGIVPVGAPNGRGQLTLPTYLQPLLGDQTTAIGGIGEPNLETIVTLEPDLIVYSDPYGPLAERIPELEQIAPVVVPYVDTGDWHWKSVFMAVADTLGKTAEAETWIQAYDARAAELGAQLPDDVGEVSIVRWMADGPRILLSNAFSSQVLSDVGFERPQYQLDLAGTHPVHTDVISMEQVELIDADLVFAGGLNPEGDVAMETALADPLVETLTAVQSNRLFLVDGLAWSSTGGPTAALQVLDDLENALNQINATGQLKTQQPT